MSVEKRTIVERLRSIIGYGNAVTGKDDVNVTDVVKSLVDKFDPAGLYDDAETLVCTYDDLVSVHGLNAEMDYTKESYITEQSSGYNVLQKPELSNGTKLILDAGHVGSYSFRGCATLTSVEVRRAKTMGDATFLGCPNLVAAKIYCTGAIGNATFQGCAKLESCDIHGAESLEGYTFNNCQSLKSFSLPGELKRMGKQTFHGCESLTSITLPPNIKSIGSFAFDKCYNLESVVFPKKLITMDGQSAFNECKKLKNVVNMQVDFTNTCRFTFNECKALEYLDLSECDMAEIEDASAMFQTCAKLKEFKFPKNMVISDYTFNHIGSYATDTNGAISIPADCRLLSAHPQEGHIFYDFATTYNKHKRFVVNENNQYFKTDDHGALYTNDCTSLLSLPMYMEAENGRYEMAEEVKTLWIMSFNRNQTITTLCIPNSLVLSEEQPFSAQGDPDNYDKKTNSLTAATHLFTNIRNFDVKADNPNYIADGGGIYSKDGSKLITMPIDYVGVFDVKDGCEVICGDTFRYDYGPSDITGLTQVNIPASVVDIKDYNLSKLNALTQVVKVVAKDNPVYDVVDNMITLKQTETEPKYRVEIYDTEKVPYEEKPGTITTRVFVRVNTSAASIMKSGTGVIRYTKDDVSEPIIEGELNSEWGKTLVSAINTDQMPGYCVWSYSTNGVPEGRFIRYVAFATIVDDEGEHFIYSNEVKLENDGTTATQTVAPMMRSTRMEVCGQPEGPKDYLEPDPVFDFE